MDPTKFAAILMSKLEIVKREQDLKEKLDRNILEVSVSFILFSLDLEISILDDYFNS